MDKKTLESGAGRQVELRKLIRSLSKVSEVETREVRASIERDSRLRNKNRRRRAGEQDNLLRERRGVVLPNLLSSYKLFMRQDKKVESIKQRYIDSQAFLKRANFQYKKIQLKKQDIAHKQHKADLSHASAPDLTIIPIQDGKVHVERDPFDTPNHHVPKKEIDSHLLKRLKHTVDSCHKEMKNLYQSHFKQVASLPFRRRMPTDPSNQDFLSIASKESYCSGPQIKPTNSVIIVPSARGPKKTVNQLIKVSSLRSRQDQRDCEPTTKEQEQQLQTERIILSLQAGIDEGNRLKETLVLGQLKKLLYGDRRGRFIQDSTFRTRLRGEYSEQYMNIVQEQQNILNSFQGSYFNRKNLVQKFANILGTLRTNASHEENELVLG